MVCCIGFGEFNKKYLYILFAVLSKLIAQLILPLKYSVLTAIFLFNDTSPDSNSLKFNNLLNNMLNETTYNSSNNKSNDTSNEIKDIISSNPITYFTFSFFCSLIFGMIFLNLNRKIIENNKKNSNKKKLNNKAKANLIYNNRLKREKIIAKTLILIGLIFVFAEIFDQIFYSKNLGGLDYWMFDYLFLTFFMKKYLKRKNTLHQNISIFICVISSFIIKVISNFLTSEKDKDNNNIYFNKYNFIKKEFNSYLFIPLFILLFISMNAIRAFGNTKVKYLTDFLYVSPYRILLIYGLFGFILCLLYIITFYIFNKFFKINMKENFPYLGDFSLFYKDKKKIILSIRLIIYGICNSFKTLFDLLIIYNLSPFYMYAKYKVYYLLIQIILLFKARFQFDNKAYLPFYLVEVSSDIICFFGILIYLELIELRCKGLNYELVRNIRMRSEIESFNNLEESDSFKKILDEVEDGDDDDDEDRSQEKEKGIKEIENHNNDITEKKS